MSFPPVTEMFQFTGLALCSLWIQRIVPFNGRPNPPPAGAEDELEDRKGGFPHSEISGSKGASASPELIAACHVLLRLSAPRHPSEALFNA